MDRRRERKNMRTNTGDGTEPCVCGHTIEEHGNDSDFHGSTACTECDCIAYEAVRKIRSRRATDEIFQRRI